MAVAVPLAVALAVADAVALGEGDALCGLCFPFSQPRCFPGGVPNGGWPGVPCALGLSPVPRPVSIKLVLNVLPLSVLSLLFSEDSSSPTPRSPVSVTLSPRPMALEF